MDRSTWMYQIEHATIGYLEHLSIFLKVAEDDRVKKGKSKIHCPCKKCLNWTCYTDSKTIKSHLIEKGFMQRYTCWYFHGEVKTKSNTYVSNCDVEYNNDLNNNNHDSLNEMLHNLEGNVAKKNYNQSEQLFVDSEILLYEGCEDFTKLSATYRLMNVKEIMVGVTQRSLRNRLQIKKNGKKAEEASQRVDLATRQASLATQQSLVANEWAARVGTVLDNRIPNDDKYGDDQDDNDEVGYGNNEDGNGNNETPSSSDVVSSYGPSTPQGSSPGFSIHQSSFPRTSGSLPAECSNCKVKYLKIKMLDARLKLLEARLEMKRHPKDYATGVAYAMQEGVAPSVVDITVEIGKQNSLNDTTVLGKKVNVHTLFTLGSNGIDVVIPVDSIRAISKCFANIAYGFFLGKKVAYPVVANYVRNTWGSMDGLDAMLKNGPWFVWNNPLILKKWHPDKNLLKEDVSTVTPLNWIAEEYGYGGGTSQINSTSYIITTIKSVV
nr:hypothetical protein [Tanacetum cinerariifolium]